ncbi:hypothetical protein M0R89_07445 [Halorussus limi]|uniref:Uncharacterized protein n=1 Tax=Halorussus limi TaxID=2938695 RepID=A0A8U0HYM0_9EURY|nr:E2/UBC family protein [Halorussus limi]UPV75883.1 hypothetical protein M0R89_07445 [Halorussus limi]
MPGDNDLPDVLVADIETLEADGFDIDIKQSSTTAHVIFRDFELPEQFDPEITDLLVNIHGPRHYPRTALDMFWTETEVTLQNGELPEKADCTKRFAGREWRRFSWHRGDSSDPDWDPAYNDLVDHVAFIEQRLWELS